MSKTVGKSPSNLPSLQEKYEATVVSLVSRITNALQKKSAGNNAEYNKLLNSFNETCSKPNILGVWFSALSQCANILTLHGEEIMATMMQYNFEELSINQQYFEFLVSISLVNPICMDQVAKKLVSTFITPNSGLFTSYEQREEYFNGIQRTISKIMSPAFSNLLFQNIVNAYPDKSNPPEVLELFLMNTLYLIKEYPMLREKLFSLIVEKLISVDVEVMDDKEDEEDDYAMVFSLDSSQSESSSGSSQRELIEKLDMMLSQILCFIERNSEIVNSLFDTLLNLFDRLFLPSASKYLQFIYFFICSKHPQYTDAFLKHLFQKIPRTDQLSAKHSIPQQLIENSILYVGSFIARLKEISISSLVNCCYSLSNWAVAYINHFPNAYPDVNHHRLFYHIAHCLLYILCFKFAKVMESAASEEILSELNTIVASKLNPLKIIPEAVVSEFTSVLAVLQHKKIKELEKTCKSIIYNNKMKQKNKALSPLLKPMNNYQAFGNIRYPFDPLKLQRSLQFIEMYYNSWEGETSDEEEDDDDSNSSSSFKHSTSFSDDDIVMSYTPVETTFDIDFFSHSPINYGRFHK